MSPFVALYGHEPRHWGIDSSYTCASPVLEEWLEERKAVQKILQQNLNHARQYMKAQADKKRSLRTFELGDEVFVKLQPYAQSSVTRRSNHKLAFRYFGPYPITRCINPVAYEVNLPQESKIHPIFHVSQLRKVMKQGTPSTDVLPVSTNVLPPPVKILARRWHITPTGRREQIQVQWHHSGDLDITWEDKVELQQQYPDALAWGQANTGGGGDVNSATDRPREEEYMDPKHRQARPKRLVQPNRRHAGPEWTK